MLPSEWGTAKKPWFFLTANYWCPGSGTQSVLKDNLKELEHFESEGRDSVEPVEDELRSQVAAGECVAIRGELVLCCCVSVRRVGRAAGLLAVGWWCYIFVWSCAYTHKQ